ncbi:hypothetical protein A4R43_22240 [Amycolatopsis albispora]|uniref:DUF3558 domain-containing protein n=1 Tax=Amycolatopsis albispora TaxID=1804986 RepID=A0A344LA04_9PSEU|nr:hypothetical protein A4R43_22240 [Amycolatopsis albispora]
MLVTLLSGCASTIIGKPSPDRAELARIEDERSPLTAAAAFGDFTTIDYCSLLDAAALGRVTEVVEQPGVSMDHCTVRVKVDGQEAELWLGGVVDEKARNEYTTTTEIDNAPELKRRLTIEKPSSDYDGNCNRYLVFADEFSLQSSVSTLNGTLSSERLCPLVENSLEHAATAVVDKRVEHLDFPAGSLGTVDACTLISEAEVGTHLGAEGTARRSPTKHNCRWGRSGSDYVSMYFSIDKPTPPEGYVPETLGGRPAMVWASSGSSYCSAQVPLKPWPGAKNGEVETVSLFVSMYRGGTDPCGVLRNVANTAFPRLPA